MSKPIAITVGDPAGIGPEVVLKTLLKNPQPRHPWVLVGARWSLQCSAEALGIALPAVDTIKAFNEASAAVSILEPADSAAPTDFCFGQVQAACGDVAVRSIELAATGCLNSEVAAMVTAPINKDTIQSKDFEFSGHTDYLAKQLDGKSLMFMISETLKVALVSDHIAVKEISGILSTELLREKVN